MKRSCFLLFKVWRKPWLKNCKQRKRHRKQKPQWRLTKRMPFLVCFNSVVCCPPRNKNPNSQRCLRNWTKSWLKSKRLAHPLKNYNRWWLKLTTRLNNWKRYSKTHKRRVKTQCGNLMPLVWSSCLVATGKPSLRWHEMFFFQNTLNMTPTLSTPTSRRSLSLILINWCVTLNATLFLFLMENTVFLQSTTVCRHLYETPTLRHKIHSMLPLPIICPQTA